MNWSEIFTSFGISTIGFPSIIGIIYLLFKKTINKYFNEWFERRNLNYQAKLDTSLETHKAELNRTSNELQERLRIEYGSLYKKRIDAIEKIYNVLFVMQMHLEEYPIGEYCRDQETLDKSHNYLEQIIRQIKTLKILTNKYQIYFSVEDVKSLQQLNEELSKVLLSYNRYLSINRDEEPYADDPLYFLNENKMILTAELVFEILGKIKNNFRLLIGVK